MPVVMVKGMSCQHCVMSVTKALTSVPGLTDVSVDLLGGKASYSETSPVDPEIVKEAIRKIGFEPGDVK